MKRLVVFLVLLVVAIGFAYWMTLQQQSGKVLPVINPRDVKPEMVDPEILHRGMGHRIGKFAFQNQYGDTIALEDVRGNVFVAEYFFTTCGTICPRMTEQMTRLQHRFRGNEQVKLLSFTVNPDYDSVEIMLAYAQKYGAEQNQWHFLTGNKAELYTLARTSFFVLKPAEAANLGDAGSDFIHTNNFVLVDKQLRIRGYYDGTSIKEVNDLMNDIDLLLKN